jgi:hypothetical protein
LKATKYIDGNKMLDRKYALALIEIQQISIWEPVNLNPAVEFADWSESPPFFLA